MGFRVVKGNAATERVTAVAWKDETDDASDEGEQLFNENCAACHQERDEFQGLYGKDPESLFTAIKFGGNNVMSMPAFGQRLSDADIRLLANYVLSQNGW
jgi:mono/diheme cytochrome c family protein